MKNIPMIYGHRGASGYAPENTLEAFQLAHALGADGVELDIQFTKDREIVVCHDETIDRTSNGTGRIIEHTLTELKTLHFNKTHPEYTDARIPTMKEVFELLSPTGMCINIELKTGILFYEGIEEAILQMSKDYGMEDRVLYSSFNHYSAKKIHELKPDAKVGFLYEDGPIDFPAYAKMHGADAIHPALYNLQFEGTVEKAHELGMQVNTWTVNTEEHLRFCASLGVDGVIGNYPDLARKVLESL